MAWPIGIHDLSFWDLNRLDCQISMQSWWCPPCTLPSSIALFFNLAPLHILQVPLPAASLAAHHRTAAWLQPSQFCHIISVLHLVYQLAGAQCIIPSTSIFRQLHFLPQKRAALRSKPNSKKKKKLSLSSPPLLSYELKLITHPSLCLLAVCVLVVKVCMFLFW